ncbi:GNAT family N-acetyltransferase [Streptomyces sp. NPDC088725]|uniref:GNAT family N-acetyltransferase n=1 Tax=Streptomyces sp. NPDC088725 TaxID=3365873 RepID=UPI00380CB781
MVTVSPCAADDPELLPLVEAMNVEIVALYEMGPDARLYSLGPDARYLLARREGRPVGCCAVRPARGTDGTAGGALAGIWELNRVFVARSGRRTGVAAGMLAHAEEFVRQLGGVALRLETGDRQPNAMRLYERAGYLRIPNYPPHEHTARSRCYEKNLRPLPGPDIPAQSGFAESRPTESSPTEPAS